MLRSMEESALNSWPALQQMLYDGWVLRFSKGYTKRANSVNPLYLSRLESIPKVAVCENLYRERSMPPIFRLTPLAPEDLDSILDVRGYKRIDPTLVMRRDYGSGRFLSASFARNA